MPKTLFGYIARQFLMWCGGVFFVMLALIFMSDLIELIRRGAARPEATMLVLIEMASLKLPYTAQEATPFAILLGSILAFWRMTRTQELVVARAAGISVWQFLLPGLSIAFMVGALGVTIFNPVASATQASYKVLESRILRGGSSALVLSDAGLWLRQSDGTGSTQSVIHAARLNQPETRATDVTIFFFRQPDLLTGRIDAKSALLENDRWRVTDAWEWRPGRQESTFSP
jgi:lipopolysaccharide export system permease protein